MVSGRDKERLIEEAVAEYTAKDKRLKERNLKARENDNSESFFRLAQGTHQQTWQAEKEKLRLEGLLNDKLEFLSVHRGVEPNPDIFDTLYVDEDRTEDVVHDPETSRKRAKDRCIKSQLKMEETEQVLKSIRDAMSSPTKLGASVHPPSDFDPGREDGNKLVNFLFNDAPWKPHQRFEMQLRNRLDDLGSPYLMDMPCRIRRIGPDRPGFVVEMRGSEEKCLKIVGLGGIDNLVVYNQNVTQIWESEAVDDPLGDLIDFFLLTNASLDEAWKRIDSGKMGVNKDMFTQKLRTMGYHRDKDARICFHALDDGTGRVTSESFLGLQASHTYAKLHADVVKHSQALIKFSDAVFNNYSGVSAAFDAFNARGDGHLTLQQFVAGAHTIHWNGPAEKVFHELDARECGYLRQEEFAELGTPEVRHHVQEKKPATGMNSMKKMAMMKAMGGANARKSVAHPRQSVRHSVAASPNPHEDEPENEPSNSPSKPKNSANARPKSAPSRKG
jgi:hypothetical protein